VTTTPTTPPPAITTPTGTTSTGSTSTGKKPATGAPGSERNRALLLAQAAWVKAKERGVDMTDGPCIAERLPGLPDWVVDIAHKPRLRVDDDPANQCTRFLSGEAHHFVELTPKANLIRAR
jgi:hypothetical protein